MRTVTLMTFAFRRRPGPLALTLALLAAAAGARADEWKEGHGLMLPPGAAPLGAMPGPDDVFLPVPPPDGDHAAWLAAQDAWRRATLAATPVPGEAYARPEQQWVRGIFTQVQLPIWDRTLYDPDRQVYTVDRFLDATEPRLGHLDSVLLWQVYPNVGVDDRNQLDLLKDLPLGPSGLKALVAAFHRHGTRVFFPYLVWTTTTRPAGATPERDYLQFLADLGADGINFDTLDHVPPEFAALARDFPAIALEPQFTPPAGALGPTTISWNDWVVWDDVPVPQAPRASRAKWLEPRHQGLVTDRYARVKVDSLHHAFFNGQGYAVLENLWGFWSGMSDWDAEAVLRCTAIERSLAGTLASPGWEPYAPTLQAGVYASRFPAADQTVWTFVNRNEYMVRGEQLAIPDTPGARYFDLWRGREVEPVRRDHQAILAFELDPLGFGAILCRPAGAPDLAGRSLLATMAARSRQPLDSYSRAWAPAAQTLVEIPTTPRAKAAPPGMVKITGGEFDFTVRGIEIESANDPGVDVQFPWESTPRRTHRHLISIAGFYIDRAPVTKAEFKRFLDAAHYQPADDHNFLRDWAGREVPPGAENEPVTWVAIEDARAYAAWAGKRLPHDWEWQFAAQGPERHLYPWGSAWDPSRVPPRDAGPVARPAPPVGTFAAGTTPTGLVDLVGSVYQWTDEFTDDHTRAAILRGAPAYQPAGSIWFFPRSYRLDEHQKYLLMSPGRDRAGTIGFRCVVDEAP